MSFNKGYELKKFEAHWEKLRIEYAAAGMTKEAIQKMYDYDRQQFNSERTFIERTQEIQPGQEIVYTAAQQQIKIDQADVEVITSWKDGKLIFRDTPFKEVLKMLSKRFDVDFVVKNPKCFEASFTGVLEKQRLGRILEYISVSSNIKFKYAESNNIHQEKQKIEVY
jgi:ferric-dicitrate binding protein FerR (iron transport regulator)